MNVLGTQPYTKPKSVNVTHVLIKLKDRAFTPTTSGKIYFIGLHMMRKRSLKLWFSVELKCRWLLRFFKIETEALTAICQNQSHLLIRQLLFVRSRTAWIKLYLPDPQVLLCCGTVNHMNWANRRSNGKMWILESPHLYPCQVFLKQRHVASECSACLHAYCWAICSKTFILHPCKCIIFKYMRSCCMATVWEPTCTEQKEISQYCVGRQNRFTKSFMGELPLLDQSLPHSSQLASVYCSGRHGALLSVSWARLCEESCGIISDVYGTSFNNVWWYNAKKNPCVGSFAN